MAAQSHITLRELRDLLAVQPPAIDIPPGEARPGDLVAIKDLAGSHFLSIQNGVLVVRADLNAELQQFAVDSRRAPERVRGRHRANQRADLERHGRPPHATTALPRPE